MRLIRYAKKHLVVTLIICLAAACLAFNAVRWVTGSRSENVHYSEDGGINIDNGSIWDDPSPEQLLGPGILR